MHKTYIVTGGAGFIGSHLSRTLIEKGNKVYILDDLSTGLDGNIPEGAIFYKLDITDSNLLFNLEITDRIDCIFHLAAQSSGEASFENALRDIDVNYKATYNILKLAQLKKCERFIFSSSMSVYGELPVNQSVVPESSACNPVSYYGCNKLASEKLISVFTKNTNIKYTIFRIFNAYGPGQNMTNMKQGMASIYLSYLSKNVPVHVKGSLARFRDFVYIDDVVEAFIKSESCERTYRDVFNLGTSIKTTVGELLSLILCAYKKNDFNRWVIVEGNTAGDISGCVADITKLKKTLKWQPKYKLEYGIDKMKEWIGQRG